MLLAELEVWHSRPFTPTRRVALGHLVLPVDPAPGFGGLLLGAVVATHIGGVDDELVPDIHRLISQVEYGQRIVQPRLRHRYQVDRHGLTSSVHRLLGAETADRHGELSFEFGTDGKPLQQVLGAIYAVERLTPEARSALAPLLHKAMRWRGPIGPALVGHLAGTANSRIAAFADPRAWAMEVLGFPVGSPAPGRREVKAQFRVMLRDVHPDYGASGATAAVAIDDLAEARRILLA